MAADEKRAIKPEKKFVKPSIFTQNDAITPK